MLKINKKKRKERNTSKINQWRQGLGTVVTVRQVEQVTGNKREKAGIPGLVAPGERRKVFSRFQQKQIKPFFSVLKHPAVYFMGKDKSEPSPFKTQGTKGMKWRILGSSESDSIG